MSRKVTGTGRVGGSAAVTVSQVKPGSILQSAEQPSPAAVLPSSHSSAPSLSPSPQRELHTPPVLGQLGSTSQNGLQPSPTISYAVFCLKKKTALPSTHTAL